jgi:polyphosphate kinase
VRFIYDQLIEDDTLQFFLDKMKIVSTDSIIPAEDTTIGAIT